MKYYFYKDYGVVAISPKSAVILLQIFGIACKTSQLRTTNIVGNCEEVDKLPNGVVLYKRIALTKRYHIPELNGILEAANLVVPRLASSIHIRNVCAQELLSNIDGGIVRSRDIFVDIIIGENGEPIIIPKK